MDTQNITLAVPKKVLAKFKEIAFRQQKSVSGLMVEIMKEKVDQEESYRLAYERHKRRMIAGIDLQTHGNLQEPGKDRWTRDDLHER